MVESRQTRLIQLQDINDVEECHRKNFTAWAQGLTQDQYLQREKGVKNILESFGMHLTYWALESVNQETGKWEIVSACETLQRPALLKVKGQPVKEIDSISVGSVFTPPEHRKKNYAKDMMKYLVDEFDAEHVPLIALWSDVGEYYAQFGYRSVPAEEITIKLDEAAFAADGGVVSSPSSSDITFFTNDKQITEFAKKDKQLMSDTMDADTERDGKTRVAISPEAGVFLHTKWRAIYLGPFISLTKKESPTVFGGQINRTSMTWTQDFGSKTLYITRVQSTGAAELEGRKEQTLQEINQLLHAAVEQAKQWKFPKVSLWAQDVPRGIKLQEIVDAFNRLKQQQQLRGTISCEVTVRSGSLPMYHVENGRSDEVEWDFAGKYAWF